ncbi:hypothetical protein C8R45DRAFT_937681 [Mycena sanguinolenta]|nr:hypothetical protein C8R45DRAFT_937681 [Mycena sanguinolenta]
MSWGCAVRMSMHGAGANSAHDTSVERGVGMRVGYGVADEDSMRGEGRGWGPTPSTQLSVASRWSWAVLWCWDIAVNSNGSMGSQLLAIRPNSTGVNSERIGLRAGESGRTATSDDERLQEAMSGDGGLNVIEEVVTEVYTPAVTRSGTHISKSKYSPQLNMLLKMIVSPSK